MKNTINIITIISIVIIALISGITYDKNLKEKMSQNNELGVEEAKREEIEKYSLSTYITPQMKENAETIGVVVCYEHEYTPEYLLEECDAIAIIRVISHDGVDTSKGLFENTVGRALINNRIYGQIEEGAVIKYIKAGAYMDKETWNNAQPEASRDRRIMVRKLMGITTPLSQEYINTLLPDDIDIEIGKTYLAYLNYIETYDEYEIIGLGFGLRELDINQETEYVSKINIDLADAQILNNKTNEYESLIDYIQKYIEKGDFYEEDSNSI